MQCQYRGSLIIWSFWFGCCLVNWLLLLCVIFSHWKQSKQKVQLRKLVLNLTSIQIGITSCDCMTISSDTNLCAYLLSPCLSVSLSVLSLQENYILITDHSSETVHRQDSSPTCNLETVHLQNWRQFTDTGGSDLLKGFWFDHFTNIF